MKYVARYLAALLALLALVGSAAAIHIVSTCPGEPPVLLRQSQEAQALSQALLDAVSAGDYQRASAMIQGAPELGVEPGSFSGVGRILWDAYQDSLEYQPLGECFATESGLARRYRVRYLNVEPVLASLGERAKKLLGERVANAENMSDVYDQNNDYREDVVTEVLQEAAAAAVAENAEYLTWEFTVNLICRQGQWLAVPDSDLLRAISGGLAG